MSQNAIVAFNAAGFRAESFVVRLQLSSRLSRTGFPPAAARARQRPGGLHILLQFAQTLLAFLNSPRED